MADSAFSGVFGGLAEPVVLANVFVYFNQSNMAGKVIVFALLIFSLLAWTVMVGKHRDLKRLRELNLSFEKRLADSPSALNMDPALSRGARGPYAILAREAGEAFARTGRLSMVVNTLQRAVAQVCIAYESKMVLLGSIVTGAPFLGLLGTVWGGMDAFGGIGAGGAGASIQTLAPGVSGALLTTVAGLLVAIPSVFGYNFLLAQTKTMVTELENFAGALADRIEQEAQQAGVQ